ncbi:hypothetical protein CVT26_002379 [Gymnopilus dilepis]|uniref:Uncharacterized protein n=1 Tax=Gymnopilus dilepis TaxID=231916 RepID=A0A409Y3V4_9AGAR|nr:hypothetical protein CVT26_002379 [Gymnopilus dilepis]
MSRLVAATPNSTCFTNPAFTAPCSPSLSAILHITASLSTLNDPSEPGYFDLHRRLCLQHQSSTSPFSLCLADGLLAGYVVKFEEVVRRCRVVDKNEWTGVM